MLWKWRGGGASLRRLTDARPHRQEQGQTDAACPTAGHTEDRNLQLWSVIGFIAPLLWKTGVFINEMVKHLKTQQYWMHEFCKVCIMSPPS